MSTVKTILIALGIAAAANQILPPLMPDTSNANCDNITECPKVETD